MWPSWPYPRVNRSTDESTLISDAGQLLWSSGTASVRSRLICQGNRYVLSSTGTSSIPVIASYTGISSHLLLRWTRSQVKPKPDPNFNPNTWDELTVNQHRYVIAACRLKRDKHRDASFPQVHRIIEASLIIHRLQRTVIGHSATAVQHAELITDWHKGSRSTSTAVVSCQENSSPYISITQFEPVHTSSLIIQQFLVVYSQLSVLTRESILTDLSSSYLRSTTSSLRSRL